MIRAALLALLLLTGCDRQSYGDQDNKIVCGLEDRKAYQVQPGAGMVTFLRRVAEADALCSKAAA